MSGDEISCLWSATWPYVGGTGEIKLLIWTLGPYLINALIASCHRLIFALITLNYSEASFLCH